MRIQRAIDEFVAGYFSTHQRSKKTRAAYSSDLGQFGSYAGKGFALQALSGVLIEKWAAHLRDENYSPASMRRKIVVLKVFCSYWVRRGELAESPFWRVKLSFGRIEQLPRALSETEMRTLLAQAARNYPSAELLRSDVALTKVGTLDESSAAYRIIRNLAIVDLLFATGIRVGEASKLDLEDYLISESVFRVQGKGGRDRLAFVVDAQSVKIQLNHFQLRSALSTDSPALFLNASGQRLSTQGIANVISQCRQKAGLKRHVTPHMLRHTVATLLLRNGVDIRVVQEFLGHASIATTQRYTHVAKDHLLGVLRKHHPSLGLRKKNHLLIEIPETPTVVSA